MNLLSRFSANSLLWGAAGHIRRKSVYRAVLIYGVKTINPGFFYERLQIKSYLLFKNRVKLDSKASVKNAVGLV